MNTLDFNSIAQVVQPDAKKMLYEANKHRFVKVAFDVFKMNDSPFESYWILEKDVDGKEYLIAKYEDNADNSLEIKSSWQALPDKEAKNMTIFYKSVPVHRCSAQEFGFTSTDVHLFQSALVDGLTKNASLRDKLLMSLPEEKQVALKQQFPELNEKA